MKITSGILRNRLFNAPNIEVRPTKSQVREAIFSSLGGHCNGLSVLDLFAGSGGLGLEAWSRGAAEVTFVEQHALVWNNLKANVEALQNDQLGAVHCLKADGLRYPSRAGAKQYDLIFIDPPYDLPDAMEITLGGIREHGILAAGGQVVYERRANDRYELPPGWQEIRNKEYGYTRVLYLMLSTGEDE
jgi:16S rRNA (guanine966-N2)-methyltransferase